jgi:CRP-like cAMP-binding protein
LDIRPEHQMEAPLANRLLLTLPAADFSLLEPFLKEVPLEQGMVLHEPGEMIESVYFPQSGMISLLTVMRDGAAIETAAVGREGVVGAVAGFGMRRAVTRAVVQVKASVLRVSTANFQKAVERSEALRDILIRYNEMLLAQVQQTAACNALHTVEARMGRWLLQTRDRIESDKIPLTQEFLSEMLGVRRTTVSLVARTLQSAGLIRYRRGVIEIVDRVSLKDSTCECYDCIRSQIDRVFPKIKN